MFTRYILPTGYFFPSHTDIALVFGRCKEKDVFLSTFKINKCPMPILFNMFNVYMRGFEDVCYYFPDIAVYQVIAREVRTSSNLSSTAIVTVYLEDANDNAPVFDVPNYEIRDLSELTQPNSFIASLPKVCQIVQL